MLKGDAGAVAICRQEARAVDMNRNRTPMESLSAHDEFGLALLTLGHDARQACAEFDRAISLAPEALSSSDGEWGQLHWHRGEAEYKLGRTADAFRDYAVAEGLGAAAKALGEKGAGYRDLVVQLVKRHASLLEAGGRHDEGEALLKKLDR